MIIESEKNKTTTEKGLKTKDKNDPSRFLGEGITFKAKLIGILEVNEARGDKMCQDALNDLKTAIRAAGEHKQRITISISIDGLRLRDEKTGDCLYHHPVHKISFIAQDMTDSRAFGYIFGSPDTGHRFFGIKTDKTASQVVISMRDLFQVVFELKKKEIEMAKHHSEQHQMKYVCPGYLETVNFGKDDGDQDKGKGKYSQLLKSRCVPSKSGEVGSSDYKGATSEAIADLLDLEHELNSIQQGINQMEKITPSDPFGPISKGESYVDPFDDSFPSKIENEDKNSSGMDDQLKIQTRSEDSSDRDKHSSFFSSTVTSTGKGHFFSQFSPGIGKPKDDSKWFDQEAESLFSETVNVHNVEPTSSPIALSASVPEPEQGEGKKSPIKTDLFTDLDPLGTGRVKPYVDKKDFFQELKNPPKKVLKELISDTSTSESPSLYFPANFQDDKNQSPVKSDSGPLCTSQDSTSSIKDGNLTPKMAKTDPFEDGDPFEKTDPFQEENFPNSIGFPQIFGTKSLIDKMLDEKLSWKPEKTSSKEEKHKNSSANLSSFSSSALRVSLPPEKAEVTVPLTISTITSKLKPSPDSPDDLRNIRRKYYQTLRQCTAEASEESPIQEEPFISTRISGYGPKAEFEKFFYKDRYYSIQSPPFGKRDNPSRIFSSVEIIGSSTPDPPPRTKATIFSIKPPPLPPKKQNQPAIKPPARPPSLESTITHYDSLDKKEKSCNNIQPKEELKCMKLKKQLFTGKDSQPSYELRKQNSETSFPVLPPPPHRKTSSDGSKLASSRKEKSLSEAPGSILNLTLNQLDNTGLENLAVTLGIPSENIYSMTLQELTKMLSEKYQTPTKSEEVKNESFEVDFDANFGKSDPAPATSYDKYAVFKELIESESKAESPIKKVKSSDSIKEEKIKESQNNIKSDEQEEDKYAALRQLSLNAPKSENISEDDENSAKASNIIQPSENSPAIKNLEFPSSVLDSKADWNNVLPSSSKSDTQDNVFFPNVTEKVKDIEEDAGKESTQFSSESQLFPLEDQFSEEKKPTSPRDNWATFEKSDFEDTSRRKSSDNFNENENSPFSSDGKEEVREIPFHWHQKIFRKRTKKEIPWKDDDESWDDYSPKESFCSDESSHEERSPDAIRENRYEKTWIACSRPPNTERMWNRRDKWQEETEDEFEETWRKQRERTGSHDTDRKNHFWHSNYDNYNKRFDCYNSRSEPWDENERHQCFGSRRKRSQSDNEYRKRCDSDVSDKDCVWTFQKGYSGGHGRTGKQKQYHGASLPFKDCSEYCHESRTKHRKPTTGKRPSSASDSKKTYEQMYSPGEFGCRGSDKTYPGRRDVGKNEYPRHQSGFKDTRYRGEGEFSHYYSSFDRQQPSHLPKTGSRTSRASVSQNETFPSPKLREGSEGKNHDFGYFEPFSEKSYKYKRPETRFQFDSEVETFEKPSKSKQNQYQQDFSKSPDKRSNQWASTNGDGFHRNNNESFAHFSEDFKTSPKKSQENERGDKTSQAESGKPQAKNRNLAMVSRQESSTTLRKSDSINIFSRDKDPFEGDDFFSSVS